jgi:thioredoxin-related protein
LVIKTIKLSFSKNLIQLIRKKYKILKKIVLFFYFLVIANFLTAQIASDTIPAYKRLPNVPPFNITLVSDSSTFAKDDLKKRKQTLIILFSPECGHCEHTTTELLTKFESFKNIQIIMASNVAYDEVKKFYIKHKIANYPNIKMGVDNNYFLGSFYKLTSFPTIFLYNKKGKYKATFTASNTIEDIIAAL